MGRGPSQVGGRPAVAPPLGPAPRPRPPEAPPHLSAGPGPPRWAPTLLPRTRAGGGRSGASAARGAVSSARRGGAPDDPSPLRPLLTAYLVPVKVTGKGAAPGTPALGPFQAELPSGAQAGGRLGPPSPGVG